MSEVKSGESVYVPAPFPKQGRLPYDPELVRANYERQTAEVQWYRQELNAQRGLRGASTCARSLHISLFFDGTNNNEHYDTHNAEPPHPTNIARFYHASLDQPESGYFRYYIPGVGTPFPEIGGGAAEARTFFTWLSEPFDTPQGAELPEQKLIGLPLRIEFLGLRLPALWRRHEHRLCFPFDEKVLNERCLCRHFSYGT